MASGADPEVRLDTPNALGGARTFAIRSKANSSNSACVCQYTYYILYPCCRTPTTGGRQGQEMPPPGASGGHWHRAVVNFEIEIDPNDGPEGRHARRPRPERLPSAGLTRWILHCALLCFASDRQEKSAGRMHPTTLIIHLGSALATFFGEIWMESLAVLSARVRLAPVSETMRAFLLSLPPARLAGYPRYCRQRHCDH